MRMAAAWPSRCRGPHDWWYSFPVDLEELRAFIAVADTGSLLAAAGSLRLSRTTLRRRVEALEARVGTALFVRTRRGLSPTGAGELLLARGRDMVTEATALLDAAGGITDDVAGVVRLAIPVGMPPHGMGPWFASLRRAHPRLSIDLRIVDDATDLSVDEVDVALHWDSPPARGRWTTRDIARIREWLFAAPVYLRRHGTPRSTEDLSAHSLLVWIPPRADANVLPLRGGGVVRVQPAFASTDVHLLRQCAIHGMGIAFLPDAGIPDPGVGRQGLVSVLPNVVRGARHLRCSVPRVLAGVPRVRAVARHAELLSKASVDRS